jgi:chemotaxis signal transduction protein
MAKYVRFRAPGGQFALAVEHVSEVRNATELTDLPAPRPGVVGLVPRDDDALPVLSLLGSTGSHIIVVEDGTETFGLLVEEVLGVNDLPDDAVSAPPEGQDRAVVAGVASNEFGLVLLLDLAVLTGRVTGR